MMPAESQASLIDRLPAVRGELLASSPLARFTWFKVGGLAEVLFHPADEGDLAQFLASTPLDVPIIVIGNSSNLLIRDGGVDGVVIRLGRAFSRVRAEGTNISAGAAAADINIARHALNAGISGLEFLAGIPGTLGGGILMNAGAYGAEISDILIEVRFLDRNGNIHMVAKKDIEFSYRTSNLFDDRIIVSASLEGCRRKTDEIVERMEKIRRDREATQPIRTRTGGSTFKNPDGYKAWELIDAAGCRGLSRGSATVSEQHCNFLINRGGASAADLEGLGEEVRRRVKAHSGILLEWEIRCIGNPLRATLDEVTS